MNETWESLPRAFGGVAGNAVLKAKPEDFRVEEVLGFEPSDNGEFVWLQVEKTGANTRWIARKIAEFAGIPVKHLGYGGLKDRQAVTRQWFSLPLGRSNEPDWSDLESDELRILQVHRHGYKLRRGDHTANRFSIRLRDLSADRDRCNSILVAIKQQGFPNYFGEQRFGIDNGNLAAALAWFNGEIQPKRAEQGYYLSAVRALLFNRVLAERVEQDNWCAPLPGDLMESLEMGHCFPVPSINERILSACRSGDLSPTGPLYGKGEPKASREAGELETKALAELAEWAGGLERQRMRADRRILRCLPADLEWSIDDEGMTLAFELPTGAFATALLREVVCW